MTEKKSSKSRRKLLKSIAAGSGAIVAGKSLPDSWSKPVVDSVMLPAHAATSPIVFGGGALRTVSNDTGSDSMLAQFAQDISDAVVSPAQAGEEVPGRDISDVCAPLIGDMLDVTIQTSENNARRNGMLSIDGTPGLLQTILASDQCEGDPRDLQGAAINYTTDGFDLRVGRTDAQGFPDSYTFSVYVPLVGDCPDFQDVDGDCEGKR